MEEQDTANEWDQSVMGTNYTKVYNRSDEHREARTQKEILFRRTMNNTCLVSSEPKGRSSVMWNKENAAVLPRVVEISKK